MERALAVVDADESTKALVREAGELATAVDAELVLLHVTTDEEYRDKRQAMEEIPDSHRVNYSPKRARDGARQFAADVGREALAGVDVEFEAVGALGDEQTRILREAEDRDCDHLFVAGERRSPAGKAIFGDLTQSVILNFDGPVTVVTE